MSERNPGQGPAESGADVDRVSGLDGTALTAEDLRRRHHGMRQPLNALHLFGEALRLQLIDSPQSGLLQRLLETSAALEVQLDALFQDLTAACGSPHRAVNGPQHQTSATPQPEARPGVAPTMAPAEDLPLARVHVVLVDDDDATRMGTQLLLESWGAEVRGFEGLPSLEHYLAQDSAVEPAVAVVDYHLPMPGGGIDALGLLQRRFDRWLPCVLITGDEMAATTNALVDGSIHCLVKPVQAQPLLAGLLQQLREGRPGLRRH